MIKFEHPVMETEEYKELFKSAKLLYPTEYDYFLHLACINQLMEESHNIIKSDTNIENIDEIQEEHTS